MKLLKYVMQVNNFVKLLRYFACVKFLYAIHIIYHVNCLFLFERLLLLL